jgi:hypothetical protein
MNSQDEMTPPRGETHHYGLSETPAQSTSSQAADTQTPTGTPFTQFNLNENTLKALTKMGFTHSTEIQTLVVPVLLEGDNDLVALASTGSGKTAAFGIPLMERVSSESKQTQGLILCPTRELAVQVSEQLEKLGMGTAMIPESANFSNMADLKLGENLVIDKFLHKTFIAVTEGGTEAAGATAVVVVRPTHALVAAPPEKAFSADHPFLYFIKENQSSSILFAGRFVGP